MNNLSIFLYLADVLPSLSGFIGAMSIIAFLVSLVWWIITFPHYKDFGDDRDPKSLEKYQTIRKRLIRIMKVTFFAMIVCGLIPQKETILLIAGSEAAETVITSPDGAEILQDIKTIIKQNIKDQIKSD